MTAPIDWVVGDMRGGGGSGGRSNREGGGGGKSEVMNKRVHGR